MALLALGPGGAALAGPEGRVRVVDGDTLDVGGVRVRLFGIDAPETDQHCRLRDGSDWACGAWSAREVRARYEGARAVCDDLGTDRYGRVIGRCRVAGRDIAGEIVGAGLAQAYRRYSDDYLDAEKAAAVAGRGIFGAEMADPADHRAAAVGVAREAPAGCAIKGNVSGSGKIYHMPGQEHYDRTRISEARGERWFCSEAEALSAGWRKSRR